MTNEEKQAIIAKQFSTQKDVLTESPTIDDLISFSNLKRPKRWKRNRRLYKKFKKRWFKYLPKRILKEYCCKLFTKPLRERLNYESIAQKIFKVEPLPQPNALTYYQNQ